MENQHRKISGYRELSQQDIDLMNEVKALGPQIEAVIKKVEKHVHSQRIVSSSNDSEHERLSNATPERFIELSKTDMQTGMMYLTRAIAQPEFF